MKAPKLDKAAVAAIVKAALAEDIGKGDVTSRATVPAKARMKLAMNARQDIVVCGMPIAKAVVLKLDPKAKFKIESPDGTRVKKGTRLALIEGNARALLTAERTALNIVQFLSGISTLTRQYADQVEGTGCVLLDIRKTIPGLRVLSKYATRVGGATNHRMRLDDGILIKDNHLTIGGGLEQVIRNAHKPNVPVKEVQVECDTLEQVAKALAAGADRILLDNMDTPTLKKAVELVKGRVPLEASGGITIENVREKALTGVTYVSTGKITQSAPGVDIGMDLLEG
jgi:nicotinate-nucleotide pyrophosphorylase (carboxylating)